MEVKTEKTPDDFVEKVQERWKQSKAHSSQWRQEARADYEFVAGKQWTDDELGELEDALRPAIVFNRIGPVIDSVCGHQVNNRQDIRFTPRQLGDVQVSEILTGAAAWVDDECDAEDEISDSFWDLVISGMGWTETRISYDSDPDGKIHSAERISPLEVWWDSSSRKRNLSDAQYVFRGRWIPRKEAEARWPKMKELEPSEGDFWEGDDRLDTHDAQEAWKYESGESEWNNPKKDEVFVLQYQWCERKPMYRVLDPMTGELVELDEKKYNKIKDAIDDLQTVKQVKKYYYQAFLCGSSVLEKGDCPCPHSFTLLCMTGKRDMNDNTYYGLVRGMRDPQRWANKFFAEIQDILVSNRTGGAFVEESALANPRQAEEKWNQPNPLITVRDGALGRGAIQERNPIAYPAGLDRLMNFAVSAIRDVSGVNLELMGLVDRQQAGVLEAQRKQAGMTILSSFFDALRRYQKERGRVLLYFIQTYISDGRLIKIIGGDGTEQYIPLMRDQQATKYDIIVDQSPTSTSQKEETFAVLQQLLPALMKMGAPIPPDVLDYMPLPSSLVSKWKEMMVGSQQDPQAQAEAQKMMADVEQKKSQAALNYARAQSEGGKNQVAQFRNQIDGMKTSQDAKKLEIEERRVANQEAETVSKMIERATL